jgi:hypothetical protein
MFVKNDEEFIKLMDENPDLLDLWYFKGKTAYYYNQVRYDKLKKKIKKEKKDEKK